MDIQGPLPSKIPQEIPKMSEKGFQTERGESGYYGARNPLKEFNFSDCGEPTSALAISGLALHTNVHAVADGLFWFYRGQSVPLSFWYFQLLKAFLTFKSHVTTVLIAQNVAKALINDL